MVQQPGRNAVTDSSIPAQIRDTSDFEMPASRAERCDQVVNCVYPWRAMPCYPKSPTSGGVRLVFGAVDPEVAGA